MSDTIAPPVEARQADEPPPTGDFMPGGDAPLQLWPMLDAATESALRASIERWGVLVPVAKDQHGRTIDGHHRARIADELGVKYARLVHYVENDEDAHELARTLNADRRHLTTEQRRDMVAHLREQGHSTTAIGAALGVDQSTVSRDLQAMQPHNLPDRVTGADGKSYPAKKKAKAPVFAKDKKQDDRVQATLTSLPEDMLPDSPATAADLRMMAKGAARDAERERLIDAGSVIVTNTDDAIVYHSPVSELARYVAAGSVDCIITDPPYPAEYLPVYAELAEFASHALRPGGSAFVMVGQSFLPAIMNMLDRKLVYHWTLAYLTPGGQAVQLWDRNVNTFWKPVLWFVNGSYDGPWLGDVCRSDVNDNDKRFHGWGQSESGMIDLVERASRPGDVVCDPFCGGGTTGAVAIASGRRFIGADSDEDSVMMTRGRLSEVAP